MTYTDPHNQPQGPEAQKPKRKIGKTIALIVGGFFALTIVIGALSPTDAEPDTTAHTPIVQVTKDVPATPEPDPTVETVDTEPANEEPTAEPTTEDPEETTEPEPEPETEPEFDSAAATTELEETIRTSIGGQDISDFCDGYADTSWFCFFDHYEVVSPSRVNIHMEFYGGLDTRALAEDARTWTASMLYTNLPEITTIVSYDSTGLDLGTTRR